MNVAATRLRKRLTLEDLMLLTGLPRDVIADGEEGRRRFSARDLLILSVALQVPSAQLLKAPD